MEWINFRPTRAKSLVELPPTVRPKVGTVQAGPSSRWAISYNKRVRGWMSCSLSYPLTDFTQDHNPIKYTTTRKLSSLAHLTLELVTEILTWFNGDPIEKESSTN